MLPLEGLEEIEIDGTGYEAFNTSGGLGSLAETYGGRVRRMDYKTIRYPGHCEQIRLLMNGLKLNHDRDTLKRILENAVPQTLQDVVIIYAAVTRLAGRRTCAKKTTSTRCTRKWSPGGFGPRFRSRRRRDLLGMDIVLCERTPTGFLAQEQFRLATILDNRFGSYYAHGGTSQVIGGTSSLAAKPASNAKGESNERHPQVSASRR